MPDKDKWFSVITKADGSEEVHMVRGPKDSTTPLKEFTEAIDDPDYDPDSPLSLRDQRLVAESKRSAERFKKGIESGEIEMVETPVEGLPDGLNIICQMARRKKDVEDA